MDNLIRIDAGDILRVDLSELASDAEGGRDVHSSETALIDLSIDDKLGIGGAFVYVVFAEVVLAGIVILGFHLLNALQ